MVDDVTSSIPLATVKIFNTSAENTISLRVNDLRINLIGLKAHDKEPGSFIVEIFDDKALDDDEPIGRHVCTAEEFNALKEHFKHLEI